MKLSFLTDSGNTIINIFIDVLLYASMLFICASFICHIHGIEDYEIDKFEFKSSFSKFVFYFEYLSGFAWCCIIYDKYWRVKNEKQTYEMAKNKTIS